MKSTERGILIGLAVVLFGATGFLLWRTLPTGDSGGGGVATGRVPPVEPVREFTTPGGVTVQVLEEGRGKPRAKGEAMDIAYVGYLAESGAKFGQDVKRGWVLEDGGVIPGWIEGLADMKRLERRRLLIPPEMGYGAMRRGSIMPNSALVYDVQWAVLDIHDLAEGSGTEVREGDTVTVLYKGTLENGEVFDTNFGGDPISFPVRKGGLIDGWVLGVPGMRVGGKRRLWVPWHLAYKKRHKNSRGPGFAAIPPFSNLIFEIELVGVK